MRRDHRIRNKQGEPMAIKQRSGNLHNVTTSVLLTRIKQQDELLQTLIADVQTLKFKIAELERPDLAKSEREYLTMPF